MKLAPSRDSPELITSVRERGRRERGGMGPGRLSAQLLRETSGTLLRGFSRSGEWVRRRITHEKCR